MQRIGLLRAGLDAVEERERRTRMKGSLIVVGFFILGLVAGRMDALPAWMAEGGLSFVALCGLLLCVGMSIGLNPDMKSDFKIQGWRSCP
jgi:hypothetical protein